MTNQITNQLGLPDEPIQYKDCRKCGRNLPFSCFKRRGEGTSFRRVDLDCKECQRREDRVRNELRKTAPPSPPNCEICNKQFYVPESYRVYVRPNQMKPCLDHCHKTGRFRGWICDSCNVGLSRFNDDPKVLRAAVEYLEKT